MAALLALSSAAVRADYEAPLSQYDPGTYYSSINTASVSTLQSQLHTRVQNGYTAQTYDKFGTDWAVIDADPDHSGYVIEIYTRKSTKVGDSTLSREHQWVNARLPDANNAGNGDYFNLRPLNNTINSTRSNLNYTSTRTADGSPGKVDVGGVTYWYPGDADRGDTARVLFYMSTMYNMTIVNGNPQTSGVNQMGDLTSLLHNNYADGVDNYERRRNVNVQSYQKNRNPFVDHPEYVWAIFGGGNNNSQLSVATPSTTGASATTVTISTVIKGGTLGSGSFTLSKSGDNPTTMDILTDGSATTASAGVGQNVDYGTQAKTITVGVSGTSSTVGLQTGHVTVKNTDLTTSGTGHGSADGADTVTVNATVLDHSNASFSTTADVNSKTIDLGTFNKGTTNASVTLANLITDLSTTAGYTAGLDLDSITAKSGNTSIISLSGAFTNLSEMNSADFLASMNLNSAGSFSATYQLGFSDQNLSGATSTNSELLTLTLTGTVAAPEPAMLSIFGFTGIALLRRRRN